MSCASREDSRNHADFLILHKFNCLIFNSILILKSRNSAKRDSIMLLREDPRCRDIDPKFLRGNQLYTAEPIHRVNSTVSFTFFFFVVFLATIFNFQFFLYLDDHTDRVCSQAVRNQSGSSWNRGLGSFALCLGEFV